MKDKKNQQKRALVLIGSLFSLVIVLLGSYYVYQTLIQKTNVDGTNIQQDEFYSIRNNATAYQIELYENLNEALHAEPKDNLEIATWVAQNYVADFYTWTNKFRLNDVGGIQFVIEDIKTNVYQSAQASLYGDVYYYLNNGGLTGTLEVESIRVINAEYIDFFIFDSEGNDEIYDEVSGRYRVGDYHDAMQVEVAWNYVTSDTLNVDDYDSHAYITLMLNDVGAPMIVEVTHEN